MSTLFQRNIARCLRETERVLDEQVFTFKGADIPCIPSSLMRGVVIEVGGNPVEIQLSLFVRLENFLTADSTLITVDTDLVTADNDTPAPVAGELVKFRGKNYRILSAKQAAPLSHVELHLADPDSGRS